MSRFTRRFVELGLLLACLSGCTTLQPASDALASAADADPPSEVLSDHRNALEHLEAGRVEAAVEGWRALTVYAPEYPGPWLNLVLALQREHDYVAAETEARKALEFHPEFAALQHQLAVVLRHRGQFAAAKAAYQAALAIDPGFALAQRNLGVLCDLYLNDLECAQAAYAEYQQLSSEPDAEVNRWLADLQRRVSAR